MSAKWQRGWSECSDLPGPGDSGIIVGIHRRRNIHKSSVDLFLLLKNLNCRVISLKNLVKLNQVWIVATFLRLILCTKRNYFCTQNHPEKCNLQSDFVLISADSEKNALIVSQEIPTYWEKFNHKKDCTKVVDAILDILHISTSILKLIYSI